MYLLQDFETGQYVSRDGTYCAASVNARRFSKDEAEENCMNCERVVPEEEYA